MELMGTNWANAGADVKTWARVGPEWGARNYAGLSSLIDIDLI